MCVLGRYCFFIFPPFFKRLFLLAGDAISTVLITLLILTVLSRLGVLSLAGLMVVYSTSMEPGLRHGDLILYAGASPRVGDVVVWCATPSHCVVHRFTRVWNGDENYIVTKGDANPYEDNPVPRSFVRGVVYIAIPRILWIPLIVFMLAVAVVDIVRVRFIGYSYALYLTTTLVYLVTVFSVAPPPLAAENNRLPTLHLSRVDFNPKLCTVSIEYSGELRITSASARVDGVPVKAYANSTRIVVEPLLEQISSAVASGRPLYIEVEAELHNAGVMRGGYSARVEWRELVVGVENGFLVIENPNCYPVTVNTTFLYAHRPGEMWRVDGRVVVVGGFERISIEPPSATYIYSDVSCRVWGDTLWRRLQVR